MQPSSSSTAEDWVYSWDSQAQIPAPKLLLFNRLLNHPVSHCCLNISVDLLPSMSDGDGSLLPSVSFSIPRQRLRRRHLFFAPCGPPRPYSPSRPGRRSNRVLEDHVEVRLALVLPVDRPLVSDLRRMMATMADEVELFGHSDVMSLSSKGSVDFYCRNCSSKLTTQPTCHFTEMSSVYWQEAADNWFFSSRHFISLFFDLRS